VQHVDRVERAEARGAALAGLAAFRRAVFDCFGRRADGLFEVMDALAGADRPLRSVAQLTLEPTVRRGWGSLYQALQHGTIDVAMLGRVLAERVGVLRAGWPLMFAVDASIYPRPDTRVVPDVGMQYAERGAGSVGLVRPGWSMQWLCQVGEVTDTGSRTSWAPPLDVRRVATNEMASDVAAVQVAEVWQRLAAPARQSGVLFLFDAGYCVISLTQRLPEGAQLLGRLRSNRVFYRRPEAAPSGRVGRRRLHGERFALRDAQTWGRPDAEHRHVEADGTTVHTRAWHGLHPQNTSGARTRWTGVVEGTLIRRESTRPGRATRVWWLWWAGPSEAFNLPVLAQAYEHRFTIEHGFRFGKQDLFWTGHTPLDPDQAERWSWLVALAYTNLYLARPLAADLRMPWERPCPAERLSPRRVRRQFRRLAAELPACANPPKTRHPGPGRPKGSKNITPRPPQPRIKKRPPRRKARKPQPKPADG
jgi:hypothetical protein